jgi:NAD(P)-dependent dehydrogenase (short-subunit alcohol dehydrogenase family)
MDIDVTGLRVIITAGASGIGLATADEFLAGGARVQVCDVDAEALARFRQQHPEAGAWHADVSDEAAVDAFVAGAIDAMGGVDVLVNNAGITGPGGRLDTLELDAWNRTIAVNVNGTFLTSRRVIPHLVAQGSGSIVNMSSTAGLMGFPNRAPYAAAKWAIIGLTKTMAMELGEFGIRVNAICPGAVDADRMRRVVDLEAEASGRTMGEVRAGFTQAVSLQTFVDPADIASMIRFVCSPAGAKISGQALSVDGHTESARS